MWDILPGIEFVTQELPKFNLHPAHSLSLACQYQLLDWISAPIQILLASPLECYTKDSKPEENMDFDLYMIIRNPLQQNETISEIILPFHQISIMNHSVPSMMCAKECGPRSGSSVSYVVSFNQVLLSRCPRFPMHWRRWSIVE